MLSGKRLSGDSVEELSLLGHFVQVEESQVSEVLILKSALDLHGEIIVHFQHGHCHLILIISTAKSETNSSPCDYRDLSHVPASPLDVVCVPGGAGEDHTDSCGHVLEVVISVDLVVIALESWVELSILRLPQVVVAEHLKEQILVHWIVDNFSSSKLSAEDILSDWILLGMFGKPGVHFFQFN